MFVVVCVRLRDTFVVLRQSIISVQMLIGGIEVLVLQPATRTKFANGSLESAMIRNRDKDIKAVTVNCDGICDGLWAY